MLIRRKTHAYFPEMRLISSEEGGQEPFAGTARRGAAHKWFLTPFFVHKRLAG